ncbi:response regulator [Pseudoduganella umbonata]|uniref:CheY-like chemotaxis protein n=1 Tax=Pseudoduganella umbonata TaxID=864828 RepID=A0A4P8HLJ4_9BURK|nr:response regulator [Pseudoduganella umbonata]MBB3224899.1 CheY-like chemotaxis protein [Pseudoduganella umbonata]QCP09182.1 response regulator [Pseudoduganella umbonata]
MESAIAAPPSDGAPLILLVEDNPDDVLLAKRAFKKAALSATMEVVSDGDEAVGYLDAAAQAGGGGQSAPPSLILLDLKLPKRPGLEVLRWIRANRHYDATPVVVLTSSTEDEDIQKAYALGANSYLQKPVAFNGLVQLLGVLGLYWLQNNLTASPGTAQR